MCSNGRKQFWSKVLSKYQAKTSFDYNQRLAEDTRRVSVIHQLNEVGFQNVSELSESHVVLKIDENDPTLNLKLDIPANFPTEPFSVDSVAEINPTPRLD